jgi:sortase A
MTVTHASAPPRADELHVSDPVESVPVAAETDEVETRSGLRLPSFRRIVIASLVVLAVFLVAVGAVIYGIGSLVHARDQRSLMATERLNISNAAVLEKALDKVNLPTQPPALGQPVGVLAIPALGINQAVVEGVGSSQTVSGPGHVPGTAGLGQPSNAAVVGRNAGYGGVFGRLSQLKRGDRVLTATTEGQSIYVVRRVAAVTIGSGATTPGVAPPSGATARSNETPTVTLDTLYRHTSDNRLTLITSASAVPWNGSRAIEVTAILRGKPYVATPQAARNSSQLGNTGESGAWAELVLSLQALAVIAVGAVLLYRRCTVRSAYLLSTAPLVAFTVLAAEAISRLLPAWM